MKIHNSIYFLLDHYYSQKYIIEHKSFRNKTISFYIGNTFKKTNNNKKFKLLRPIFNAICSLYLERNVVYMKKEEMEIILDEIDKSLEIVPRCFHLEDLYKTEPMSPSDYNSLLKYNFYDLLLFEYANYNNREEIFEKMEIHNLELRKCEF